MKNWDAIIVGAGIIGLSLAIDLNKQGLRVLIVEKGELGREASWAAGGMLVDRAAETRSELRELATASAAMYPEFVRELEDESGLKIDLRSMGSLVLSEKTGSSGSVVAGSGGAGPNSATTLEPALSDDIDQRHSPLFIKENCVDPRQLTDAAIAAARHRGIDFSSRDEVLAVEVKDGKTCGVRTNKTQFSAGMVVNCAGAWAGQIAPHSFPTRPVKGQMLCVIMPKKEMVRHVIRAPEVYLIPRSDGRIVIGATVEEAGFDKQTVPETIQKLRQAAVDLVPKLAKARFLSAWAGLRPAMPDGLPILGVTSTPGYFVATGHFRDGILLAPVTARVMEQVISGKKPELDLNEFAVARFRN